MPLSRLKIHNDTKLLELMTFLTALAHNFRGEEVQRDQSVSVGLWRRGIMFEETGMN